MEESEDNDMRYLAVGWGQGGGGGSHTAGVLQIDEQAAKTKLYASTYSLG
jgi:hypothetical protein